MRRRSGLMGAWLMGAPGLEVRLLTPRSSSRDASLQLTCLRRQRPAARSTCLKLARSAFVQWPAAEVIVNAWHFRLPDGPEAPGSGWLPLGWVATRSPVGNGKQRQPHAQRAVPGDGEIGAWTPPIGVGGSTKRLVPPGPASAQSLIKALPSGGFHLGDFNQ